MQQLRNSSGQLIGLREDTGNQVNIRASSGVLLGWYDKRANVTRRSNGSLVGYGDLTSSLL